jgi:hypothetical protein
LTFGAGEKTKTIIVPILDDGVTNQGARSILVGLDTPLGGLTLGTPSTTTVWLIKQ